MNFLFIHQNFPGQFRHIATALAADQRHQVLGLGDTANVRAQNVRIPGVKTIGYNTQIKAQVSTHNYLRSTEENIRRGQNTFRAALKIKRQGFLPDVVIAHPAWGEATFLRDVFPQARHIYYYEYFYQATGGDVGFDLEFPTSLDNVLRLRVRNTTQLMALVSCDQGLSPTQWQKGRYPLEFSDKIKVIHDGIRSDWACTNIEAVLEIAEKRFLAGEEIVTYVARNLEPYRGFHTFMRALPEILQRRKKAQVLVVGGDDVSYGQRLPEGNSYRQFYCDQLKNDIDWSRVHFLGRLPYALYLKVLQVSAAHIYLTYPFVLSWSLLEAMSAGCVIVGSATPPVQEVIENGRNGLLVDFFDSDMLAHNVVNVLQNHGDYQQMRNAARQTILDNYDLKSRCLPQQLQFYLSATEG